MHIFRQRRARVLRTAVACALGLFALNETPRAAAIIATTVATTAAKAATHTVSIEGTGFQPQTLTVKAGDSIVWVNKDPFPHTATSQAAGFDSTAIAPGKSWRYIARKRGDFAYICMLHPTMKATLRVE